MLLDMNESFTPTNMNRHTQAGFCVFTVHISLCDWMKNMNVMFQLDGESQLFPPRYDHSFSSQSGANIRRKKVWREASFLL